MSSKLLQGISAYLAGRMLGPRYATMFGRGFGPKFVNAAADVFVKNGQASVKYRTGLIHKFVGKDSLMRGLASSLGTQLTIEAAVTVLDDVLSKVTARMMVADEDWTDATMEVLSSYSTEEGMRHLLGDVQDELQDVQGFDVAIYTASIFGLLMSRRRRALAGTLGVTSLPATIKGPGFVILNAGQPSKTSILVNNVRTSVKNLALNPLTHVYGVYATNGLYKGITGATDTNIDKADRFLAKAGDNLEEALGFNPNPALDTARKVSALAEKSSKILTRNVRYVGQTSITDEGDAVDQLFRKIRGRLDHDGIVEVSYGNKS